MAGTSPMAVVAASDLPMMWDDWEETVTYRVASAQSYNSKTGKNTPTTADTSLVVIRGPYTPDQVSKDPELRAGDVWFKIQVADYAGPPTQQDQIIDGSDTFEVFRWDHDADENVWQVDARRKD